MMPTPDNPEWGGPQAYSPEDDAFAASNATAEIVDRLRGVTLAHYTSQSGLLGILQEDEIWLTSLAYVNDSAEVSYALDLLRTHIEQRHAHAIASGEHVAATFWEEFREDILSREYTPYSVYCFSLSAEQNDLSQWRGYGRYAVHFDSRRLATLIRSNGGGGTWRLTRCIYSRAEAIKLYDNILDQAARLAAKGVEPSAAIIKRYVAPLRARAAFIKHPDFAAETEWRIAYDAELTAPDKKQRVEVRPGHSAPRPYVKLKLTSAATEFPNLADSLHPIVGLRVGPLPLQEQAVFALERALDHSRAALSQPNFRPRVDASSTPYRE